MESVIKYITKGYYNIVLLNKNCLNLVKLSRHYINLCLKKMKEIIESNTGSISYFDKVLSKNEKKKIYIDYFNNTNEYNLDFMKIILLKRNNYDDYDYLSLINKIGCFNQDQLLILFLKKKFKIFEKFATDPENLSLVYASCKDYYNTAKLLLEAGIDVSIRNQAALVNATRQANIEIVNLLIDNGADIFFENHIILHIAVDSKSHNMVQLYLEKNIDVHANNASALCMACEKGYDKIVGVMLKFGADPKINNSEPIKIAKKKKRKNILKLFYNRK